jgi:hypothetical protein
MNRNPLTLSPLLTEDQAAEILTLQPQTLATWRCTRRYGLPFVRVGRAVRYRLTDLENFLASRTVGGPGHTDSSSAG